MTDTDTPHDPDATARLADYFRPGGFPGFTIDNGRAWTSEQVRDVLTHHREFLRQMISVSAAEVLAELADAKRQLAALKTERDEAHVEVERCNDAVDDARTAARALTVFCRQAGCTEDEIGAVLQAYSPKLGGVPAWLTRQVRVPLSDLGHDSPPTDTQQPPTTEGH